MSLPLLCQEWETRLAHHVRHCSPGHRIATPRPTSPAPRSTLHASRWRDQWGQVAHRPFPPGYRHSPTTELVKTERGPISTTGLSLFSMSPNQAILEKKLIRFFPTRRRLTVDDSLVAGGARRQRHRRACKMAASSRDTGLCMFPYVPPPAITCIRRPERQTPQFSRRRSPMPQSGPTTQRWLIRPILAKLTSPCACGRAPRSAGVSRHSASRRLPWPSKMRTLRCSRSSHFFW